MPRQSIAEHVSSSDILQEAARRVADPDDKCCGQPYEAVCEAAEALTGEWWRSMTPLANLAGAVADRSKTPDTVMGTILDWAETAPPADLAARMREVADMGRR